MNIYWKFGGRGNKLWMDLNICLRWESNQVKIQMRSAPSNETTSFWLKSPREIAAVTTVTKTDANDESSSSSWRTRRKLMNFNGVFPDFSRFPEMLRFSKTLYQIEAHAKEIIDQASINPNSTWFMQIEANKVWHVKLQSSISLSIFIQIARNLYQND